MQPRTLTSAGAGAAIVALVLISTPALAIDPPDATDINPDPDIVEVNLEASETTWQFINGIDTTVYAYNGTIPGPTIRAKLGDTVIVHFTNNLPEPTTIHWHGVDTPASMDGSNISQLWVQPGDTFDYQFVVNRAALFWYHPHVRTFDQVEKGLYGGLLVEDVAKEAELGLDQIEEHIIFFDDILLDSNSQIVPAFSFTDPVQNALYHLNGREGNVLLLNGKEVTGQTLTVPNGEPQRWRVVNAANVSIARLDINQFGVDLWELGKDQGFAEKPFKKLQVSPFSVSIHPMSPQPLHPGASLINHMGEGILLFPGQRSDVVFTPIGSDQESFTVYQNDWIRGRHTATVNEEGEIVLGDDPLDGFLPPVPYLEVVVDGPDPGTGEYVPPANLTTLTLPAPPVGELNVTFGHAPPDPQGNVTMFAQADFSSGTMVPLPTAKIDSFNAQDVKVGEVWNWRVLNLSHGDHPFHTHGFPFQFISYEFQDDLVPENNFIHKPNSKTMLDTVRAPARTGGLGTSRTITTLRVFFDPTGRENDVAAHGAEPTFRPDGSYTSGGWLFHCHILEHSAKGMLSFYEVLDPNDPFVLLGKHLGGTNGNPSLTATGDLSPGSSVDFELVNALPNARVILVGATRATRQQIFGGEFVPNLGNNRFTTFADGNGRASWSLTGWSVVQPGATIYVQVGVEDPGAPQGWAFSNALKFTRP